MVKKIVLVTGPPGNGRDEYIRAALPALQKGGKIGYYHVFEYMLKAAKRHSVPHLTRENWFTIPKFTLEKIRNDAFDTIASEIAKSPNDIEIVSSPAFFKLNPFGDYRSGRVDGLSRHHIDVVKPDHIVVLIDDLLRVRKSMLSDPLWKERTQITLQQLADWRAESIKMVEQYVQERSPSPQWNIFSRDHPTETFVDLIEGKKPILYVSYHMTGHRPFDDVQRLLKKLNPYFLCIDPNAIKDWEIVDAYDKAVQKKSRSSISLKVQYREGEMQFEDVPMEEIESAMDTIRSQIVDRDYSLIDNAHAVVVYHRSTSPSYGVFGEIIHAVVQVGRPVYVLYAFRKRLSPFFEQLIVGGRLVHGDVTDDEYKKFQEDGDKTVEGTITALEDALVEKLRKEWKDWPTIPDDLKGP